MKSDLPPSSASSISELWLALGRDWGRRFEFTGTTVADYEDWRAAALPEVLSTLGRLPDLELLARHLIAEWKYDDGVRVQKWSLQFRRGHTFMLWLCIPPLVQEKMPAILCLPGHGLLGAQGVAGVNEGWTDAHYAEAERFQGDFGRQLSAAGFVTYTMDWLGVGEASDSPPGESFRRGLGWCNLYYLAGTALGTTPLAVDLARIRAGTEFVRQLPYVNGECIGVAGFSGGAAHGLWAALVDGHFSAVELACYAGSFSGFALRDLRYCGAQITPGLVALVDLAELFGMLAPRPVLLDVGRQDDVFPFEEAAQCCEVTHRIYAAAKAADQVSVNVFDGGHRWDGRASSTFFAGALQ